MSYTLQVPESSVLGKGKYVNAKGHTECVTFVQDTTGAPPTPVWKPGIQVQGAKPGSIPRGTAIATFVNGHYPTDGLGRHAAIYLSSDANGINVLDQWDSQGEVKARTIRYKVHKGTSRSNDGTTFYVIQ